MSSTESARPALFERFPDLEGKIEWVRLETSPSPVQRLEHLGHESLWIKREDIVSPIYGGNKVRKLEFVLADAIARHRGLWIAEPVEPLEAAVLWDADKLSKLGATAVLHFVGGLITYGRGTTAQILEELPGDDWIKPDWQEDTVRSFNTAPARAAGRKRWKAFRDFCQQAMQEFDGNDLTP